MVTSGFYEAKIYARLLGGKAPILLNKVGFELGEPELSALKKSEESAVFFVWDEKMGRYKSKVNVRPSRSRSHSVSGSGGGKFPWE